MFLVSKTNGKRRMELANVCSKRSDKIGVLLFLVVKRFANIGIIFGYFIGVQCLISQISGIIIIE
jgi:hypothetical protein